jgi:hypothetical protein
MLPEVAEIFSLTGLCNIVLKVEEFRAQRGLTHRFNHVWAQCKQSLRCPWCGGGHCHEERPEGNNTASVQSGATVRRSILAPTEGVVASRRSAYGERRVLLALNYPLVSASSRTQYLQIGRRSHHTLVRSLSRARYQDRHWSAEGAGRNAAS